MRIIKLKLEIKHLMTNNNEKKETIQTKINKQIENY